MTDNKKGRPGEKAAPQDHNNTSANSTATDQKIRKSPFGPDFVQISSDEAMRRVYSGVPCVVAISLAHDDWCKTMRTGRGVDCCCNPDETFWAERETEQ